MSSFEISPIQVISKYMTSIVNNYGITTKEIKYIDNNGKITIETILYNKKAEIIEDSTPKVDIKV